MKDPEHETCKLINDINNIKNESTKSSGRHGYVKTDKHDYWLKDKHNDSIIIYTSLVKENLFTCSRQFN